MQRILEPELMDDAAQARAYAEADFETAHNNIIDEFARVFVGKQISGRVLDLGCGPADISVRFAHRYPECTIDGIDGAEAMLSFGRDRINKEQLEKRICLSCHFLPSAELPQAVYSVIISNSLLHHLHDPAVLWETIKDTASPGCHVFIADLMRPANPAMAKAMMEKYTADEPGILQEDFYNSLLAAFTPEEIRQQLKIAGLEQLNIEPVSDRHLIVYGDV